MTQRIVFLFSFSQNDSNIWIFIWLKELNLLLWTSFQYDSKRWSFFFHFDSKNWNPLFFSKCLKELNLSFIWATFLHDSKNWIFSIWRKDFFKLTPKKWPCFSKMTHRIEPLFWMWRKEWNPFFLWIRRKELNPFVFECDAKNWILFLWIWRKELKALFKMTGRIELSRKNCSKTWTFFFELDAKNRTFFWMWLKILNFFWLTNSQNIELFPKNYDSKNWFFQNAQGIEPLFHMNYFFTWLELNSFLINTTRRVKFFHKKWLKVWNTFLNMTQWIDFFSQKKMMQSFFLKKSDSKNGTFLKIWFSNKNMTQIIEPFLLWLGELFFKTQRIELFFKYGSKNWISFV